MIMLAMSGCETNDETSMTSVKVEMKAITSLGSINPSGRSMMGTFEFNEFLIGATEIEFETLGETETELEDDNGDFDDDAEDDGVEIEYEGEFVIDLLSGTSEPDLGIANLQAGVYEEIEIKVAPVLPDGNSAVVSLTFTPDAGDPVSVEFSTSLAFELEIEDDNGFQIDPNALTQVLVLFDLDVLFSNIDLSSAMVDDDGVIRINADSNTQIAAQIINNFQDSCKAGEDNDDDDRFDDDDESEDEGDDD